MAAPRRQNNQPLPVYYSGSAPFIVNGALPIGGVGSVARVEIDIDNNPLVLYGIRARTVYTVPVELRTVDLLAYLARLDAEMAMEVELTQANVTVKQGLVPNVIGGGSLDGLVWDPFPTPYPFRGSNNIAIQFTRITAYPVEIEDPTVYVTLQGTLLYEGNVAPSAPASSGFNDEY